MGHHAAADLGELVLPGNRRGEPAPSPKADCPSGRRSSVVEDVRTLSVRVLKRERLRVDVLQHHQHVCDPCAHSINGIGVEGNIPSQDHGLNVAPSSLLNAVHPPVVACFTDGARLDFINRARANDRPRPQDGVPRRHFVLRPLGKDLPQPTGPNVLLREAVRTAKQATTGLLLLLPPSPRPSLSHGLFGLVRLLRSALLLQLPHVLHRDSHDAPREPRQPRESLLTVRDDFGAVASARVACRGEIVVLVRRPHVVAPVSWAYVRRLPRTAERVRRKRPWSSSFRMLNRNACSSR